MNISEVKTAKRVGEFVLVDGSRLGFEWDHSFSSNERRSPNPRVYLFTVNGVIYKIGGSESKGGILSTLNFYINARSGSPGPSRFVTYGLIFRELSLGNRVEVYLISSPGTRMKVCGLFDCEEELEVYPFRASERRCLDDYRKKTGEFPPWNFKERGEEYPEDLYNEFLDYHKKRTQSKK
ncbi:MAG: hypothetical protein ACK4G4_10185 [Thermus sp.]|uniref:hypothetical protein n=1 Tax=Thermus sp. TaxID=275 RepID=UPI00391CC708